MSAFMASSFDAYSLMRASAELRYSSASAPRLAMSVRNVSAVAYSPSSILSRRQASKSSRFMFFSFQQNSPRHLVVTVARADCAGDIAIPETPPLLMRLALVRAVSPVATPHRSSSRRIGYHHSQHNPLRKHCQALAFIFTRSIESE